MQPVVIKIDKHSQIMKEVGGYEVVKSILGNNVPTVSAPVSMGDLTGVKIDLASLKGAPRTFQSMFEEGSDLAGLVDLFEDILSTLGSKLYANTSRTNKFNPIKQFGLNSADQKKWLRENPENLGIYYSNYRVALKNNTKHMEVFRNFIRGQCEHEWEACSPYGEIYCFGITEDD